MNLPATIWNRIAISARKFLHTYPQAEGAQVSATEIPYAQIPAAVAFAPGGPERAFARWN